MSHRSRIAAGLAIGAIAASGPVIALGGDHSHESTKSTHATPHTHEQAGYPLCVSRLAHPSYNEHYTGGYVGGGKAIGGQGRCGQEGTWGWDYTPFRASGHGVFLDWSHGRRYQGGTGRYATDGPHPIHAISEAIKEHGGKE